MVPRYNLKTKLYLLDSDDSDYSHDRELNQSEYFTLVKHGVVSIKAMHMVVSMIYLKANRKRLECEDTIPFFKFLNLDSLEILMM